MSAAGPGDGRSVDYDYLLRTNIEKVFNERDAGRRAAVIAELFTEEAVLYEPAAVVQGRDAISHAAGALLDAFGPGFRLVAAHRALGHDGLAALAWRAEGGPAGLAGIDVAEVIGGRIARLWVLVEPS